MDTLVYLEISILELSKVLMYGFWYDYAKAKLCCMYLEYIIWNIDYIIWISLVSLYTSKQIIFIKTLQKMLILDLIPQIMN